MPPDIPTPQARRPVTLKRIAEELGLSVTTIARSLKDGHKISAETVQRVRATADALGYVRNLDGLRLRTGRSYTIAVQFGRDEDESDPARLSLMGGLQRGLAQTDFALKSLPFGAADARLGTLRTALRTNRADGFVLDRLTRDDPRVALLADQDVPFVTLGRPDDGRSHAGLFIDEAFGARALTAALLAEGRRRIALLDDDPDSLDSAARRQGVAVQLAEAGLKPVDLRPSAALPAPFLAAAMAEDIRLGRIDALICGTDMHLARAVQALDAANIPLAEVGLAVRSATRLPALMPGPMHIAAFAADHAGMILADLLLRRIEGARPETLQILERPQILLRG